ncbi:MAG: hypothetical protein Q8P88_02735 [Candidatus Jorgensenbacteria bacterium]|nr:hypothetical protein [Candidatus Jorgensenbacteria bacterium]
MRKGSSLIEVLIYSALLAIFIGATFSFVASILGSTDNLLERNEVVATSEFIEHKIAWLAGQATGIAVPASGQSSTTIVFTGADSALFPATFAWGSSTLSLALPGVAAAPLTNGRILVSSFLAERFSSAQTANTLRVGFNIGSVIYPYLTVTSTTHYAIGE